MDWIHILLLYVSTKEASDSSCLPKLMLADGMYVCIFQTEQYFLNDKKGWVGVETSKRRMKIKEETSIASLYNHRNTDASEAYMILPAREKHHIAKQ